MLKHLYIKNYALIDVLDIDFFQGFSVITGETGAGKSIILGAIGLLLGQRADTKVVKTNTQKCTIEATFDLSNYDFKSWFEDNELEYDEEDCIIRRELTATGKSRGFINDTPVTLQLMRELGEMLMDVHSQHQNLLLQKEDFQLNVLDVIASNSALKKEYAVTYATLKQEERKLSELQDQIKNSKEREEFLRFQQDELTNANLQEGEQDTLEQEQAAAMHAEEIKTLLYEANNLLSDEDNGVVLALRQACNRLTSASNIYPKLSTLAERTESALVELKDIAKETESEAEDIDFNPERLNYVNERLDLIYTLEKKYEKDNISELLDELQKIRQTLDVIENFDETLLAQEELVSNTKKKAQDLAEALSESRRNVSDTVQDEVIKRLHLLGMENAAFSVNIIKEELTPKGQDKVSFLFSANKGMELQPVAQVASGGEIARLMLSLKAMISGAVKLPTIIFDEIDTGVSGKIAEQMAAIMCEMGKADRQVISITHLPQIAALGTNQYKVEKHDEDGRTISTMRKLTNNERIDEIAQMLSGANITEAARINAKELLKL